jgi:DNA-binding GntR family transcriptional regulator
MNRLEEEGFVRSVPYKGTTIVPLTAKDFEEIRSLRNILEESAGLTIISKAQHEHLDQIEAAYQRMQTASARGDVLAMDEADIALHATICELSGHTLLLEVWNRYANRFRWILTFCNRVNEDLDRIVAMHEPLIEAFRTWDGEALRIFYKNHPTDLVPYLPTAGGADGAKSLL